MKISRIPLKQLIRNLILCGIGGWLYICIELAWRGKTHWTMFFLGGICFVSVGAINEVIPWDMPIWEQALIGSAIITSLEFITGCIVNLALGWNVWDYSGIPFNIMGQICLPYSVLWAFLSVLCIIADDFIRHKLFGEQYPKYTWFTRSSQF